MACLDCEGIKAQGFLWDPSSKEPAQAVSVLLQLYGMRHLRLCFGKPGIKLVRKPGLCEWGDQWEPTQSLGPPLWRGFGPCSENLWHWECACQGVLCIIIMVTLGSFLNSFVVWFFWFFFFIFFFKSRRILSIFQCLCNLKAFSKICSYIKIWTCVCEVTHFEQPGLCLPLWDRTSSPHLLFWTTAAPVIMGHSVKT